MRFQTAPLTALILAAAALSAPLATAQTTPPAAAAAAASGPTIRAELGPSVQAAQKALAEKQYEVVLQQLALADAVPNRTPYENYVIEYMRYAAAASLRNGPLALKALEATIAADQADPELRLKLMDQASSAAYTLKDDARSVQWARRAIEAGSTNLSTRLRLGQSLYNLGQHPDAAKVLEDLAARQKALTIQPTEQQLRLQAANYDKAKDAAGYTRMLEELLTAFPSPAIWGDRVSRLVNQPGFDDRLLIDALRLGRKTGAWTDGDPLVELAELALRQGFAVEAHAVLEAGYKAGLLGQGAQATAQNNLRQRVRGLADADRKAPVPDARTLAARDAAFAFNTGWNLYTSERAGEGIPLMEQALQRGMAKGADDARLRLATALAATGQPDRARALLAAVRDAGHKDGLSDLARLWLLQMAAGG